MAAAPHQIVVAYRAAVDACDHQIGDTLTLIWHRSRHAHVPRETAAEAVTTERVAERRRAADGGSGR